MTKIHEHIKRLANYANSKYKNDEYYTPKETVEFIFEKLIGYEFIKDKIIYCPCDGEQSEFVKYLKANKDKLNYKDFWYTSDDFNTHIDLIKNADLVITNPPFSKIRKEYFPLMQKYAKNYLFFHSTINLCMYLKEDVFLYRSDHNCYVVPFDDIRKPVRGTKDKVYINTIFVSSFKCNQLHKHNIPKKTYTELYKDKDPVWVQLNDNEKYLNIDKITDIPIDYNEQMLVPITILYDYFKQYFDITEFNIKKSINGFSDGRRRYIRVLVKWKNKYTRPNEVMEEKK